VLVPLTDPLTSEHARPGRATWQGNVVQKVRKGVRTEAHVAGRGGEKCAGDVSQEAVEVGQKRGLGVSVRPANQEKSVRAC
jgi:hypothetical protein